MLGAGSEMERTVFYDAEDGGNEIQVVMVWKRVEFRKKVVGVVIMVKDELCEVVKIRLE